MELLGPFVGHKGPFFGFSTEMLYLPALKATSVISMNRLNADDVNQSTPCS